MIRALFFLLLVGFVALGVTWLADQPGDVAVNWQGYRVETSLGVAIAAAVVFALAVMALWTLLRFVFRIPAILSFAAKARRRDKGLAALSRGLVAVGAGGARAARDHAGEAERLLGKGPLTLLLRAQAAQLNGDRAMAEATFAEMLAHPEARALGHRGLHVEARRRGDDETAHFHAMEAQKAGLAPWATQAVFDRLTGLHRWGEALTLVDRDARAGLLDKAAANRRRAVLKTALAIDVEIDEPARALILAREAAKLAPGLVPAATLAARLMARGNDTRKAARVIEDAWRAAPHPDLATAYLDLAPSAAPGARLAQARTLARLAPDSPESALLMAQAAVAARDIGLARECVTPLLEGPRATSRPSARLCLLMADLEAAADAAAGIVRQWLARAARAPRDATWMADGVVSTRWSPVSPVTGKLDAFQWRAPSEQIGALDLVAEPLPPSGNAAPAALEAPAEASGDQAGTPPQPPAEPPHETQATKQAGLSPIQPIPDDPGPDPADPSPKKPWFS